MKKQKIHEPYIIRKNDLHYLIDADGENLGVFTSDPSDQRKLFDEISKLDRKTRVEEAHCMMDSFL